MSGVASDVLLTLDKIEVHLGFHIFDVLDFDLLIGYPLEISFTYHQGSLGGLLRETTFATATSCSENLLAKPLTKQISLEEMMHASPFVPFEPVFFEVAKSATSKEYDSEYSLHFCEDERSSSPSIKFEPLPAGPEYVALDLDQDVTMSFHDKSLEMEKSWAKEFFEALTLEFK